MLIPKSMKYLFLILVVISLSGFGQTADDYYNKGISKFSLKDYKGAISEFSKTIILNPNYADAYINRGISKKKTLDYTGAITDYNKAIQLNPNNSDYFYNRGIAKYNLEDYNGSISDFNKAIELDSDNSDAYTMKEDATKKLKGNSEDESTNNEQEIKFTDLALTTSKGKFNSYVASDRGVYKIGDRIKIGTPSSNKTFAFIRYGDGILIQITNLPASASGSETEIKKIWVSGNKRAGYSVYFSTKGMTALANYTIEFENALSVGEIKGFGKTSNEALAELKRAKDKLDLGLITQKEFDSIKSELIKYIK